MLMGCETTQYAMRSRVPASDSPEVGPVTVIDARAFSPSITREVFSDGLKVVAKLV